MNSPQKAGLVMSIKQQVRQFILSNYLFTEDESKLSDAESLMQSGTMDSTGILELIMFLEETFDIKVGDDEMVPTNLDSVVNVVSFIERKQAA
jgi:acyl carrier protein